MENLKVHITEDEQILWEYSEVINLNSVMKLIVIILSISIIMISIISAPIALYSELLIIIIAAFVAFFGLNGILLGIIVVFLKDVKKKKELLGLTSEQLKQYEQVFLLTDKNWLQKRYHPNLCEFGSEYSEFLQNPETEGIIISLDEIQAISVFERTNYYEIKIRIGEDYDYDFWDTLIGVDLVTTEEVNQLLELFMKRIELKKQPQTRKWLTNFVRKN